MKKIVFSAVWIFLLATIFAEEPQQLTVIFTNDTHGMAWSFDDLNEKGVGGISGAKTIIDNIKNDVLMQGGAVLVVSSGNITMGDPRSNVCLNKPLIKAMNLVGYDAMSIGNHEFDFGLEAFEEMRGEAAFPFLSSNIYLSGNKKNFATPFIEKDFSNGLKVALVGITAKETETISKSGLDGKITLSEPVALLNKIVPELKKKNNIVILLSSLGLYDSDDSFDGYAGDRKVAKNVSGIDLIIGSRTKIHLEKAVMENGVPIVQTEGYGKWIGRYDFYIQNGKIIQESYRLYPVKAKNENQAVLKMLNDFKCDFPKKVIGEAFINFDGDKRIVRFGESPIGNIIADIIRDRTKTDISFINSGSVRKGISKGLLTEKDIFSVFPFMDTVIVGKIKGSELRAVLSKFAETRAGSGGFLQVSGMKIEIEKGTLKKVMVGTSLLDEKAEYTFATNSFLSGGGDGYNMLKKLKNKRDTGYSVPSIIVEFIKMEKILNKPEPGRIIIKQAQ